jgi:GTP-binding protein
VSKRYTFKEPVFVKSAYRTNQYPVLTNEKGHVLPEIAVVGRSNVGKSTLLNHLFQVKHMVKVSATPGKTQLINFFILGKEMGFVDLPGYGFAKVPEKLRIQWGNVVQAYLKNREELKLILFLLDARRIPNDDDISFFEWARYNDRRLILVLTKVDKLSKNELATQTKLIFNALGEQVPFVHYSAPKNIGRNQLIQLVCTELEEESGTVE